MASYQLLGDIVNSCMDDGRGCTDDRCPWCRQCHRHPMGSTSRSVTDSKRRYPPRRDPRQPCGPTAPVAAGRRPASASGMAVENLDDTGRLPGRSRAGGAAGKRRRCRGRARGEPACEVSARHAGAAGRAATGSKRQRRPGLSGPGWSMPERPVRIPPPRRFSVTPRQRSPPTK